MKEIFLVLSNEDSPTAFGLLKGKHTFGCNLNIKYVSMKSFRTQLVMHVRQPDYSISAHVNNQIFKLQHATITSQNQSF